MLTLSFHVHKMGIKAVSLSWDYFDASRAEACRLINAHLP